MSIVSVDNIQPIGSGTSVTVNSAATLVVNNVNSSGVVTATTFSGDGSALTNVGTGELISKGNTKAQVVDTGSNGHFKVETEGTERLRIKADGKVGIGTASPAQILHISGTGQNTLRVDSSEQAISLHNHTEFIGSIGNDSGNFYINAGGTEDTLLFKTNGSERLRISSQGQIGIEGANYGETGQVLKSRGTSDSPEWAGYPRTIGISTGNGQAAFSYIGLPSYATKITVAISRMSLSGTDNTELQLGTSAGYITSGYYSVIGNAGGSLQTLTDCFSFFTNANTSSYSGAMVIYKVNDSEYSFTYTATNGAGNTRNGGGRLIGISGTIDRLQITTSGSDTFDAGTITIYAE